jgi:HlyD family secretion protein
MAAAGTALAHLTPQPIRKRMMIRDTSAQDRSIATPAPRWPRRLLPVIVALALLAAAGFAVARFAGSERSVDGERLRIAETGRGLLVRDAAVSGRVVAANSPTLYAPFAGTVTLQIAAGDRVERAQVLAVVDSPELANEHERERALLEQLEVEVSRQRILAEKQKLLARRAADEAALQLTAAERELQRTERAHTLGALSEVEFLRARDVRASAEILSRHAAVDAGLEAQSVGFELQTREKALERQRLLVANLERRVEELTVRAPVDGVIGTLSVADRALVAANSPLLTVVDLSQLEVELEVPESYAEDLGIGMAAEVQIGQTRAPGRLSAISPEVVGNQVLARVRFDGEQPPGLRQNQRVNARVLIEERPDVVLVPRGPFLEAHGGRFAYVVAANGIAERRPIRIGATSVSAVEIIEGLEPGERIVIAGSDTFENADKVAIR